MTRTSNVILTDNQPVISDGISERKKCWWRKKDLPHCSFIAIAMLIIMLFSAGSSPFNSFVGTDSSVFVIMGRGMSQGMIPYKDLFDHKGFYLYFFNYLGALIAPHGFWGLFVVEYTISLVVAISTFMIVRIFLDRTAGLISTLLLMVLSYSYSVFTAGNTVEEYVLPFQMISLFLFLASIRNENLNARATTMFIHGCFVGVVFGIRPNMILMWGGIGLFVLFSLLQQKKYKLLAQNIAAGLAGLLLATLPEILFFASKDAIADWIFASFTFNMAYSKSNLVKNAFTTLFNSEQIVIWSIITLSIIIVAKTESIKKSCKVFYALVFVFSFVSVSLSGRGYKHYYMYLIPLCLPLCATIGYYLSKQNKYLVSIVLGIIPLSSSAFGMVFPAKILSEKYDRNILRYYRLKSDFEASIRIKKQYPEIKEVIATGNAASFYILMDVLPTNKYFYTPSIPYSMFPDPVDDQAEMIVDRMADMIVVDYFKKSSDNKQIFLADSFDETGVNSSLEENYRLLYSNDKTGIDIFVRNDLVLNQDTDN